MTTHFDPSVRNWDSAAWTGSRYVDVLTPRPEDISLWDIATGLSRECRYLAAATAIPWSVGQHSLLVYHYAREDGVTDETELRALLMHDAPEFILGDMISPFKRHDPFYQAAEKRWWTAIAQAFDLPVEMPSIVHKYDMIALASEKAALISSRAGDWPGLTEVECRPIPTSFMILEEADCFRQFVGEARILGMI